MQHKRIIKKTRKPHMCIGCHKTIRKGSRALYLVEDYDGFNYHYLCMGCVKFLDEEELEEFWPGELRQLRKEKCLERREELRQIKFWHQCPGSSTREECTQYIKPQREYSKC